MVNNIEVLSVGKVRVSFTEVCRGLKDLQVSVKTKDGERDVLVEHSAKDCDKQMTIEFNKGVIIEIKQAKKVTAFGTIVGVKLFRDCTFEIENGKVLPKKANDTSELQKIFED